MRQAGWTRSVPACRVAVIGSLSELPSASLRGSQPLSLWGIRRALDFESGLVLARRGTSADSPVSTLQQHRIAG